ncbi:MAG: hypothetical protein Q9215_001906 [Flavoplaca cf. flavocitrina]
MAHSKAVQDALRTVQDAIQAETTASGQAHLDLLELIRKLNLAAETPAESLMRVRFECMTYDFVTAQPIQALIKTLINEAGEYGAHVLDDARIHGKDIKTTPDGKTVLIPQPSSDPNDSLNGSDRKKHVMLFVISVVAFMPDFGSSMAIITL